MSSALQDTYTAGFGASRPKLGVVAMVDENADLARWKDAANAVESEMLPPSNVPIHVVFGEAVDVAKFFESHWATEKDGDRVVRRGLDSAVSDKAVGAGPFLS